MMKARTSLWASLAIAASIGLAGCGGSSDNGDDGAGGTQPPPNPKVDVSEKISLSKAQMAALLAVLPGTGDSVTLESGDIRVGVTFTCASDDPCSITVENSAGTIVAMAHSTTAGEVSGAAAGLARDRVDTFARLNDGRTESIRRDVVGVQNTTHKDSRAQVNPVTTDTEVIGMEIGGPGVLPSKAEEKGGLRSYFQANGDPTSGTAAAPGMPPGLTMGTTITIATDLISASDDMASALDGWEMRTLFRDWGDTAGDGDGGFETGAIVVTNLGEGTSHPFDRKLADRYVNTIAHNMFDLTIRADGSSPGVVTLATSVNINDANNASTTTPNATQWQAMTFDATSLVPAQSQDRRIDSLETFEGEYFGAPGRFQCLGATNGHQCGLQRVQDSEGNTWVEVFDQVPDAPGIQNGRWSFTPDEDAKITVPDQDWMVYGAWLTTPDLRNGDHRLGVVYNGIDTYVPETNSFTAKHPDGLRGSATYKGGATGIYVDGEDSGLFTADATLTADFDIGGGASGKRANGAVDTAEDYMVHGRIDNFQGTDGLFLGDDTQDDRNDPNDGGENDWVVLLGSVSIGTAGTLATTATAGSADGVSWAGMWDGRFFGPSTEDGDPIHPSGVAGQFWAETSDPLTADVGTVNQPGYIDASTRNPRTAVVGSFGATKQ